MRAEQGQELAGKVALITGSTAGVGYRSAELLARAGAKVIVSGRSEANGVAALERLRATGAEVDFVAGDLNDYAQTTALVDRAAARFGRLDILVSAGAEGVVGPKPFAQMTGEELVQALNTRIFPRIFPVHAAIPALQAAGGRRRPGGYADHRCGPSPDTGRKHHGGGRGFGDPADQIPRA